MRTIIIILLVIFTLAYFNINVGEVANFFVSFVQFIINIAYSILETITGSVTAVQMPASVPDAI